MPDVPKPTVDETIKAIAESLELLTLHSRENFDKLHGVMNALAEAQVRTEKAQARTDARLSNIANSLDSLVRIAESHEHRLDALEG